MSAPPDFRSLTASDYLRAALALLPRGRAWPRDAGTTIRRFWHAVAEGLARVHARSEVLTRIEADPHLTFEVLPDWERVAGLPDECTAVGTTLAERRLALVAKLGSRGGQSIAYFQGLATSLGYDVTITEIRPFVAGFSMCGDARWQVGPGSIRFYWSVTVNEPRVVWFRAGANQVGQDTHATITRAADLECLLNRHKPAHTALVFSYLGA